MRQSLCIISEYDSDYSIIDVLHNNCEYELKAIFLTNTSEFPTFYKRGVAIVNNTHIEYFDLCDVIYISHNCGENAEKYKSYDVVQKKLINRNNIIEMGSELNNEYSDINIPIFMLMGSKNNCEKNQLIVKLIEKMKKSEEKLAVISNYENGDLLGYYAYPFDFIYNKNSFNDNIRMLNTYLHKVVEQSKCSVLLLSIPGGVCNPFFPIDCESSMLVSFISNACRVDYIMYVLPINLWSDDDKKNISAGVECITTCPVDYWIMSSQLYDSVFFNNATNTNDIPVIEVMDPKRKMQFCKSLDSVSSYIGCEDIETRILENIESKLHREINIYKFL